MATWSSSVLIVLALVAAIAPISSNSVERYSVSVYPAIQRVVTPLSNLVPFAVFDVLTVLAVVVLISTVFRAVKRSLRDRRVRPLVITMVRVAGAAAAIYLIFLGLWGLNYRRLPMAARLELDTARPTTERVMALGLHAIQQMNQLHSEAHLRGWPDDPRENRELLAAYAFVQERLTGIDSAVPGRLKRSIYGPYFRWTTVDGMIDPFALEVLANPDLLPLERSFIAAHEWAHLAGFADEAEANFVAWLTCIRADVPARYSGWLNLYWQIAGEVGIDERRRLWEAVADGPRRDVLAITDRLLRGQLTLLRNVSWRVYDGYLRANRVEEGIRSYSLVINLILRARFEADWVPVRRSGAPDR